MPLPRLRLQSIQVALRESRRQEPRRARRAGRNWLNLVAANGSLILHTRQDLRQAFRRRGLSRAGTFQNLPLSRRTKRVRNDMWRLPDKCLQQRSVLEWKRMPAGDASRTWFPGNAAD